MTGLCTLGNGWLSFLRSLEKHRPPVAHPVYYWSPYHIEKFADRTKEISSIYWYVMYICTLLAT